MTARTALVIGASGVTGTPLVEELLAARWQVVAISRRTPQLNADVDQSALSHLTLDITERDKLSARFAEHPSISHLFYCGNDAQPSTRLVMLRNVVEVLEECAPALANIHLMQGTKYYGCHLGPFKVPAQETDPRVAGADFYYSEEDFIRARQQGKAWGWTALRPHSVCGYAAGNPLNLATVLAVYGALCKASRQPLWFPGSAACFAARFNVVDAQLLARAAIWCSTSSACRNQAFNINNGDVFRWQALWPSLAQALELEAAGPGAQPLPEFLQEKASLWQALTRTHGLRPFPYERVVRWAQGDYTAPNTRLACEYDVYSDISKARRYGFSERVDSERMFITLFARLQRERVIP
jgi:nucleoside-diphosphate-sugar epimerase